MSAFDNAVGLLFKIRADNESKGTFTEVSADIEKFTKKGKSDFEIFSKAVDKETSSIKSAAKDAFTSFAQDLGLSAEQTAQLGAALPVLGTAIAGVGAAVAGAAVGFFALTKASADFGSEINDANQKSGISIATLQALRFEASQGGIAFSDVSGSLNKFSKVMGEAELGSKGAKQSLALLGVTSKDLETALGQAYQTILKYPDGFQQMDAAQKVFGKSGAELIPFLKEFGGSLDEARKRAGELGLILSDDDIKAADKFGDTYDALALQLKTTAARFTLEFAPLFTEGMNKISSFLASNQATFKEWATAINDELTGTLRKIEQRGGDFNAVGSVLGEELGKGIGFALDKAAEGIGSVFSSRLKGVFTKAEFLDPITEGLVSGIWTGILKGFGADSEFVQRFQARLKYAFSFGLGKSEEEILADLKKGTVKSPAENSQSYTVDKPRDYSTPRNPNAGANSGKTFLPDLKAQEEAQKEAEQARKEAEKRAADDLKAQIELLKNHRTEAAKIYDDTIEKIRETYKANGDTSGFVDAYKQANSVFATESLKISDSLDALQNKQADREKKTGNERLLLSEQQAQARKAIETKILDQTDENEKLLTDSQKKGTDKRIKINQQEIQSQIALAESQVKTFEKLKDAQVATGEITKGQAAVAKQGANALFLPTVQPEDSKYTDNLIIQVQEYDEAQKKSVTVNKELVGGFYAYKYGLLLKELNDVKGSGDEEKRVTAEIAKFKEQVEQTYYDQHRENANSAAEQAKKQAEDEIKNTEKVLKAKEQVLQIENDIAAFRREQERKVLANTVDATSGDLRLRALQELKKFDDESSVKQQSARDAEAKAELDRETNRAKEIKDVQTRTDYETQINKLYTDRITLSGEQKKSDDSNTQDQYDKAAKETKSSQYGGGAFGDFMGSIATITDPTVSAAAKQQDALKSLAGGYDLLKQTAGGAINSMIGGATDLLTQWILTGKGSAKAFEQMAASAIANLAVQAGVQALFDVAKGLEASAMFDFYSAGLYFDAAATMGIIAGGAGIAAIGARAAIGNSNNQSAGTNAVSAASSNNTTSSNSSSDSARTIVEDRVQTQNDDRITRMEKAMANMTVNVKLHTTATLDRGIISDTVLSDMRNLHPLYDYHAKMINDLS